jgi:hypothetical protein
MSLLLISYLVFLLAFGSYCLFFPRSVQALASKAVDMGVTSGSSALKAYVESNGYRTMVRAIGLLAYAMCVLLAVAAYRAGSQ